MRPRFRAGTICPAWSCLTLLEQFDWHFTSRPHKPSMFAAKNGHYTRTLRRIDAIVL